ncbi:MAG: tRNA 2-selenouridine(34) synthase MnmH [Bacteroidia bacterium]|nr:tRNA 2-selenouridine(34) synthase MnmH [Bacteroidia bacterium]
MVRQLGIEAFLQESGQGPGLMVDVRSPGEYQRGHIPGAVSIPLFDDAERAIIGTLYKQQGREAAVMKGLELVGPKMAGFVRQAQRQAPAPRLWVHCWRGGMRSESMAWLWKTAGFSVATLTGGYKAYRRYVLEQLGQPLQLVVLGGYTGSGKTAILHALAGQGEQVLDLEALAHHKGSAFGALGQAPQPTVEHFENLLHHALARLDLARRIWVEDESHSIGRVYIPHPFWQQMRAAPLLLVELPKALRIRRLVEEYAAFGPELLEQSLLKISRRLGGLHLQRALDALRAAQYDETASITLDYYDKAYAHGVSQRSPDRIHPVDAGADDPAQTAARLIHLCNNHVLPL